jgi:hypothetical protein
MDDEFKTVILNLRGGFFSINPPLITTYLVNILFESHTQIPPFYLYKGQFGIQIKEKYQTVQRDILI